MQIADRGIALIGALILCGLLNVPVQTGPTPANVFLLLICGTTSLLIYLHLPRDDQ